MADELKHVVTLDQEKREKERREREKKEEEEIKRKHLEKLKKKKEREKRIAKKKKKEVKRIRSIVNLPFKILTQVCLLLTILTFIILYFGNSVELLKSLYFSFLIFTAVFLGIGIIMVGLFFLISEDKIAEMQEMKRLEAERKLNEISAEQEEINRMVEVEKEIAAKKLAAKQIRASRADEPDITTGINDLDYITSVGKEDKLFEADELGLEKDSDNELGDNNLEMSFDLPESNPSDYSFESDFLNDSLETYEENSKYER